MQDRSPKTTATVDSTARLAIDRARVACDRRLLAWIGAATFLITVGFVINKFFQLEVDRSWLEDPMIGPREFSLLMVVRD